MSPLSHSSYESESASCADSAGRGRCVASEGDGVTSLTISPIDSKVVDLLEIDEVPDHTPRDGAQAKHVHVCEVDTARKMASASEGEPQANAPGESSGSWSGADDREARAVNADEGDLPAENSQPKLLRDIHEPSIEDRRAHEAMGHSQYRPWCRHCVAAMRPDIPHHGVASMRERPDVPEVHSDFCFFRLKKGSECMPTLVMKDRDSYAIAAHVMPHKGIVGTSGS